MIRDESREQRVSGMPVQYSGGSSESARKCRESRANADALSGYSWKPKRDDAHVKECTSERSGEADDALPCRKTKMVYGQKGQRGVVIRTLDRSGEGTAPKNWSRGKMVSVGIGVYPLDDLSVLCGDVLPLLRL